MLAVVKTPRIKLRVEGDIPSWILTRLKREYGKHVAINDDDESVDITLTDWHRNMAEAQTPGSALRIYRTNHSMTQAALAVKLGGMRPQHISDMEHDRRAISKKLAMKLAELFGTSVERFIG